ncbi:aspartate aminotransferase family protein [Pendulispora albinea]|uniref:Aminotransferase class III-fold pyridoxal phosphate-dependent enzyme n=1 Tax=Pendulispora albinea TaxID=2741071 RepID=A0ABZ2MBR5_9BACT
MNHEQISRIYDAHYNPTLALLFDMAKCPVESRSHGTRVYDDRGQEFLDFACGYGVFSIGHTNPRVQAVMLRQLDKLATAPQLAIHEAAAELSTKLGKLLPGDLKRLFLCGSGSEAVEIALRIASLRNPKRTRFVAVHHGFHGKTVGAMGVTGQDYLRKPFEPIWADVRFVPYGDVGAMKEAIGDGAAAVLLEPVLGGGFITTPPRGYLAEVREMCSRTGTVFVCDEVQTGFGRTGKMFAFQHDDIVPDVLILSKGFTGGHVSMAAAVVRDSIANEVAELSAADPLLYMSDTGGSPLACAVASEALSVILDEGLVQRAAEIGPYLQQRLAQASRAYPKLGLGAPGIGLMTGIQLRNNMVENAVWLQMLKRRVVTGLSTNPMTPRPVMRFFPPLIVTREEIDRAGDALDDSLKELDRVPGLALDLANQAAKVQFHLPKPLLRGILKSLS